MSRPTWEDYWKGIGNEDLLGAKGVIETNHRVKQVVSGYLEWQGDEDDRWPHIEWDQFAKDVETNLASLSSTELAIAQVAAALATFERRVVNLRALRFISQPQAFWQSVVEWATEGEFQVTPRR